MPDALSNKRRPSATTHLGIRYVLWLSTAQLVTAGEVAAVVISLSSQSPDTARATSTHTNLAILIGVVLVGMFVTALGGYRTIAPTLRWFVVGAKPDPAQRRAAINLVRNQSVRPLAIWAASGASTSLLFTQRIVRPIVAAANTEFTSRVTAPGVVARLVMMWVVNSALPSLAIALP